MRQLMNQFIALSAAILLLKILTIPPCLANEKGSKIVIVKSDTLEQYSEAFNGFVETLEKADFQFQTKVFHLKAGNFQILDSLATIDSEEQPDAILTIGTTATREIRKKITAIPIFFTMVLNPEKNGLINSNGSPVPSLSGVCLDIPIETQLKLIKGIFSDVQAIGILYHPVQDSQIFRQCLEEAQKLEIEVEPGEIYTEEDIPVALKEIRARSKVLLLISNQYVLNYSSLKYILMYGLSNNLPVIGLSEFHVKAGALLAIRADYQDAGRQAADLVVDALANGGVQNPGIHRAQKTKLFINKRTADAMGISIPIMFLSQAEYIYE